MSAPTRTVVDRTPPRSSVSPIAGESGLTAGGMGGNGRSGNIEHLVGPDSSSGPPERPREQPAEQRTEQSDQHPSEHSAGRPADHAAERPAEPRQAAEVDAARAEAGAPPVAVPTESVGGPSAVDDPAITDAAASAQPGPPASGGMDTDAIRRAWPDVLGRIFGMRRATWTFVSQHAQVLAYDGSTLTLGIGTVGLTNTFRSGNHAELVRQALIDELGVDARVDGVPLPEGGAAQAAVPPPGSGPGPDAGPDAGRDAGRDAGPGRGDGGGGPSGGSSGGAPGAGSSAGDPGSRGGSWSQGGGSDGAHTAPPTGRTGPPPGAAGGPPPSAGGWGSPGGGRSLENNPGWGSVTAPAPEWATAGPAGASPAASAVTSGPPQFTSSQSEPAAPPASRSGQSTSSAAASTGQASADAPRPSRGASAVRESIAQARAGTGQPAGEEPAPVTGDDSAVSDDDEDIEVSGDVGRTVVERVFGGRVLSETSD